jgi:hypothetical protein
LQNMAHTQFKEDLQKHLHKRLGETIKKRAGPSFEERIDKAVKAQQAVARAAEAEKRKELTAAIEKGRARPTSAVIRSLKDNPSLAEALVRRKKEMKENESSYSDLLDQIREKMDTREPLFRTSDVKAAFSMMEDRKKERRREMTEEEHRRWEHLREVEKGASKRPLLIEDPTYRAPPKEVNLPEGVSPKDLAGREKYAIDKRIQGAVSSPDFLNTDWAKTVAEIKHRADNRVKLHELTYPAKKDMTFDMSKARMMHGLPAQVRPVTKAVDIMS